LKLFVLLVVVSVLGSWNDDSGGGAIDDDSPFDCELRITGVTGWWLWLPDLPKSLFKRQGMQRKF